VVVLDFWVYVGGRGEYKEDKTNSEMDGWMVELIYFQEYWRERERELKESSLPLFGRCLFLGVYFCNTVIVTTIELENTSKKETFIVATR